MAVLADGPDETPASGTPLPSASLPAEKAHTVSLDQAARVLPAVIYSVRGRPVGFVPGRYGGGLVAVERGYFPVSNTGYRSLTDLYTANGMTAVTSVPSDYLEALAVEEDFQRRSTINRLKKTPRSGLDGLGDFIEIVYGAEGAFGHGLFAPERDRIDLWRESHRLLRLVETGVRFTGVPADFALSENDWNATRRRLGTLRQFIENAAAGDFSESIPSLLCEVVAYLALPRKVSGEVSFALHQSPTSRDDGQLPLFK